MEYNHISDVAEFIAVVGLRVLRRHCVMTSGYQPNFYFRKLNLMGIYTVARHFQRQLHLLLHSVWTMVSISSAIYMSPLCDSLELYAVWAVILRTECERAHILWEFYIL